ncbi:MAG: hypothetical protein AB7G28_09115 [Pirellulales bacterium]
MLHTNPGKDANRSLMELPEILAEKIRPTIKISDNRWLKSSEMKGVPRGDGVKLRKTLTY